MCWWLFWPWFCWTCRGFLDHLGRVHRLLSFFGWVFVLVDKSSERSKPLKRFDLRREQVRKRCVGRCRTLHRRDHASVVGQCRFDFVRSGS